MRVFSKISLFFVGLLFTVPCLAQNTKTDPRIEQLNHRLTQLLTASDFSSTPGFSVGVIENGHIIHSKGFGALQKGKPNSTNHNTVFSVGSVSKMVNAALILRLVAEGKLDLDRDINHYLTSWQVPSNRYTQSSKVTLRYILSHTAGFSQHGFADFLPNEILPNTLQTVTGSGPVKHGPVRLMFAPGSAMDYSGGGTTVSQLIVEDVTGLTYPQAAQKYVFEPLKMHRSTFVNPLPKSHGNIAKAHDRAGRPTALPRGYEAMPEMAASGLWTSSTDLALFTTALLNSYHSDNGFLPKALMQDMVTPVYPSWHGLGPRVNGIGATHVFHHGGANNSYRAWMEGHIANKNGIVILTNSARGHELYRQVRQIASSVFNWPIKPDIHFKRPR